MVTAGRRKPRLTRTRILPCVLPVNRRGRHHAPESAGIADQGCRSKTCIVHLPDSDFARVALQHDIAATIAVIIGGGFGVPGDTCDKKLCLRPPDSPLAALAEKTEPTLYVHLLRKAEIEGSAVVKLGTIACRWADTTSETQGDAAPWSLNQNAAVLRAHFV